MELETIHSLQHEQQRRESDAKTVFGFWIYLMTDCILFASLFATFAVLHHSNFGGPTGQELFHMPFVLTETLILLTSSFSCGLAILAARRGDRNLTLACLLMTFVLGASFLGMEVSEFHTLAAEGNSWHRSGFLSAFFTLVGTHGLHILTGLLWMAVVMSQIASRGLQNSVVRRLTLLSLFWHFLDLIWIFIFTIVYAFGARGI